MTQRKKKILALTIAIIPIGSLFSVFIFALIAWFWNPILAPTMIAYYSDDSNFHRYSATLLKTPSHEGSLPIHLIKSLDPEIPDPQINYEYAYAFSSNIGRVWEDLKPTKGMEIEFIGTFRVFYDGCSPAVIQITVDGREVLAYEDGKAALLEWAATVH